MDKKHLVIAVASGKGGVGKSTITALLAHILTDLGFSVGVLDADLYGPSMPLMLPPQKGIQVEGALMKPAISSKIQVMSFGFFKQGEGASLMRAPIANAAIHQFLHKVDWSCVDLLLIDLPPGTGDIPLTLMQTIPIDHAIVITTPQAVSVSDVKKSIQMFQKMNVPILGIIENMSYYMDSLTRERHCLFGEGGGSRLAKEFSLPLMGQIPIDPEISMSMDSGYSLFTKGADSICKEIILEIGIEISKQMCQNNIANKQNKKFIEIKEIDANHILIASEEGARRYRYSDLQKNCPCARCVDRFTEKRIMDPDRITENVTVHKIERLGNYAVRFQFSSGCRQGIFTWQHLNTIFSEAFSHV